jgi:hypothetical protein
MSEGKCESPGNVAVSVGSYRTRGFPIALSSYGDRGGSRKEGSGLETGALSSPADGH